MIFLNSASSAAALVFYMPGVCTHTDTEGKQRKARVRYIFKNWEKNTIFHKHSVNNYQLQINKIRNILQIILHPLLVLHQQYLSISLPVCLSSLVDIDVSCLSLLSTKIFPQFVITLIMYHSLSIVSM